MKGLLEKIDAFRSDERAEKCDDGYDFYVCDAAYKNIKQLLPILERYPEPHITSGGESDAILVFGNNKDGVQSSVRVNFRIPSARDYIYYERGDEHDALDLTDVALIDRLNWLFMEGVV